MEEGIRSLCRAFPKVRFSLEYKPKEPRTHSYMARWATRCSWPSASASPTSGWPSTRDTHSMRARAWQRRPWDDDMIVGSVHFVEYVELLFWLRESGYTGWYSMDQYPYREEAQGALGESIEFLKAIDRRLDTRAMKEMRELVRGGDAVKSTRWIRERFFA